MQWWGWMILGIALLAAELFAIDAQFYLVFLGASAVTVGLAMLTGIDLPTSVQWVAFGVIAVTLMFTVRRKLYDMLRDRTAYRGSDIAGESVRIEAALEPGRKCRVEYRGTTWTAVNVDSVAIDAGAEATIDAIRGTTLRVRRTQQSAS